jgi:hypothetical protein
MSAICGIKETQIVLRRNTIEQFKPYINPLHRRKKGDREIHIVNTEERKGGSTPTEKKKRGGSF